MVVEQIHKQKVIRAEAAGDEWVWEVVDWHCVVVQPNLIIDVELVSLNLLLSSLSNRVVKGS